MLHNILTFLQILELLGKWIIKLVKNYHITASFLFFLSIMNKFDGNSSFITPFDVVLIILIIIGIRNKKLEKTTYSSNPSINIVNENIINTNKKEGSN